jgi:hypothetical protein
MSQQGNGYAARRGTYAGGRGGNHPPGRYLTRSGGRPPEANPATKKARKQGPETVKWGDSTFMVPHAIGLDAAQNDKHQFLEQTARVLREHPSASWIDKAACFTFRFDYPTTHGRAVMKLADLKGQTETNCFHFLFIECAREDFEAVPIPAAGLTPNFQNNYFVDDDSMAAVYPVRVTCRRSNSPKAHFSDEQASHEP